MIHSLKGLDLMIERQRCSRDIFLNRQQCPNRLLRSSGPVHDLKVQGTFG